MKRERMFRLQSFITAVVFLMVSLGITAGAAAPTAQNFSVDVRSGGSYTFYSLDKFTGNIGGSYDSIEITMEPLGIFTYGGAQVFAPFTIPATGFKDLRYEAIDYDSVDSFSWKALSGSDSSNEVTTIFNISADANTAPVSSDYTLYSYVGKSPMNLDIQATDADADARHYTITSFPAATLGTAGVNASSGLFTFTPGTETGVAEFPVLIEDNHGGSTQITVTVYITALVVTTESPINIIIDTADNPKSRSGTIEATSTYGNVSLARKRNPGSGGTLNLTGMNWTYSTTKTTPATDNFEVTVRDQAGNQQVVLFNVTITAQEYKVAFDLKGGTGTESATVYYNNLLTAPAAPTKTGATFAGWYKEENYSTAWSFATDKVTQNITLYARWTESSSVITTSVTGAGSISPQNPTVVYGASQAFTITPLSGNRIKNVIYNEVNVNSQLTNGAGTSKGYTANTVIADGTLRAEFEPIPTYTVIYSGGPGGTVTPEQANATVYENETVTFTIEPDSTHQIGTVTFNNGSVDVNGGVYTTPPLLANATLVVTFVAKVKTPPTISIIQPGRMPQQVFNGKSELSDKVVNNLNIDFSYLTYATISNPDDYSIVNFGMVLTELGTGRTMDLPVVYKSDNGQFAVQIFGSAFQVGHQYSLQGYLNYTDDDTTTKLVTSEAVEKFGWL